MGHLLFQPSEFLSELQALKSMVGPFVGSTCAYRLDELESEFEGLLADGGGPYKLAIPSNRPWRTRVSEGEFEQMGRNCNRQVYGEVCGVWSVAVAIDDPQKKKGKQKKLFEFTGVASTVVTVVDVESTLPIARWKMDLGDIGSPGAYFHTHAGADEDFPTPRHPNLFATPMAAIAFMLGELFQGAWDDTVQGTTDHPNRWRSIQKRRMGLMLDWAAREVARATSSPWMALKAAKPPPGLFL
jgi:hypothetical protein